MRMLPDCHGPAGGPSRGAATVCLEKEKLWVTGIAGVIDAGTKWQLIWADFKTADGIVGTPDGGVIFAQEQTDTIRKIDGNSKEYILFDGHAWRGLSLDG